MNECKHEKYEYSHSTSGIIDDYYICLDCNIIHQHPELKPKYPKPYWDFYPNHIETLDHNRNIVWQKKR